MMDMILLNYLWWSCSLLAKMNMILLIYLWEKILFPPGNDGHDSANLPVREDPVPSWQWWTWFYWIYLWEKILFPPGNDGHDSTGYLWEKILCPPGNDWHDSTDLPAREDPVLSWQWWTWFYWFTCKRWSCSLQAMMDMILLNYLWWSCSLQAMMNMILLNYL